MFAVHVGLQMICLLLYVQHNQFMATFEFDPHSIQYE